jgi:hypothetical protein
MLRADVRRYARQLFSARIGLSAQADCRDARHQTSAATIDNHPAACTLKCMPCATEWFIEIRVPDSATPSLPFRFV